MTSVEITLAALSMVSALCAVLYQRNDHVEGYGSTMGGNMVSNSLWMAAAILAGVATGLAMTWYWGLAAGIHVFVMGRVVRVALEKSLLRRNTERK